MTDTMWVILGIGVLGAVLEAVCREALILMGEDPGDDYPYNQGGGK